MTRPFPPDPQLDGRVQSLKRLLASAPRPSRWQRWREAWGRVWRVSREETR